MRYSKRLAFLLTPLRAGSCRINVEAYGLDDLFLGAVPVEIDAVAGVVSEQEICVGNLVLDVVARQVAALLLGARIAAAPSPAPLAAAEAGSVAITMPGPSTVPMVKRSVSLTSAAARGAARAKDTETYGHPMLRGAEEEVAPKGRLSHVARVARVTAPLAVIVFAVAVLLTIRSERQVPASVESPPPAAPVEPGSAAVTPVVPPAVASATPPSSAAIPPRTGKPDASAATDPAPQTAKAPPVAPPAAVEPPTVPAQPATPKTAPAPPAMALPGTGSKPSPFAGVRPSLVTVAPGESLSSVNMPGVKLTIRSIERLRDGRVRLGLLFVNESTDSARVGFDYQSTVARDERGADYQVTAVTGATPDPADTVALQAGGRHQQDFETPPLDERIQSLVITPGQPVLLGDLARFVPFVVRLPAAGVR